MSIIPDFLILNSTKRFALTHVLRSFILTLLINLLLATLSNNFYCAIIKLLAFWIKNEDNLLKLLRNKQLLCFPLRTNKLSSNLASRYWNLSKLIKFNTTPSVERVINLKNSYFRKKDEDFPDGKKNTFHLAKSKGNDWNNFWW